MFAASGSSFMGGSGRPICCYYYYYYHSIRHRSPFRCLSAQTSTPPPINEEEESESESEPRRRTLPLLMMSSPSEPKNRHLYEIMPGDGQLKRKAVVELPSVFAGQYCIGSSQGYVFTVPPDPKLKSEPPSPSLDIRAINPLTGSTLPLPSVSLLPEPSNARRDLYYAGLEPENRFSYQSLVLHGKAFLSSSLDTFFLLWGSTLSIARLRQTEPEWSAHFEGFRYFNHDCVFYKDRLYAVGPEGDFVIFDPGNPSKPTVHVDHHLPFDKDRLESWRARNYLVTSSDGRDLFLLSRRRMVPFDMSTFYPPMTNLFIVMKLMKDDQRYYWERVFDLGGLALFVGANYSMSYYATDFPPLLTPDSIYFTDNFTRYSRERSGAQCSLLGDSGVFTIGDGRTELDEQSRDGLFLYWPPPVWLEPGAE